MSFCKNHSTSKPSPNAPGDSRSCLSPTQEIQNFPDGCRVQQNCPTRPNQYSIPPASNTGGNSGNSIRTNQERYPLNDGGFREVKIDTLSMTGKIDDIAVDCVVTDEQVINELVAQLQESFGLGLGDFKGRVNGYHHAYELMYTDHERLSNNLGFFAWGGNADTYQLYLTGEGCEYIGMNGLFGFLAAFGELHSMRLKRVDLAYDDYEGEHSVDFAIQAYKEGLFKIRRNPSIQQVGDWVTPPEEETRGRTVYVGSRASGKMMRIYEKGKQLGQKDSAWVRWELELKAVDRVLPWEILHGTHNFYVTAYPVLADFVAAKAPQYIKTVQKKAKIALDVLIDYAAISYGKLIRVMQDKYDQAQIIKMLVREGIPKRLILPEVGIAEGRMNSDIFTSSANHNDDFSPKNRAL